MAMQHITLSGELQKVLEETVQLTELSPAELLQVNVSIHRNKVNKLLVKTSELVRERINSGKDFQLTEKDNLIGANLRGTDLKGADLRGKWLIAAELYKTDYVLSILLEQTYEMQMKAELISRTSLPHATILPPALKIPEHWR
ncbi:pentapeptide repeat-containing protein [Sediminibacillus halophilus]|uniref:pentapeptide repeat-containing protein n=1 Tax=Sediminibacillus halophilus TaxID=482461 RepID=UPI001587401E|nr:pentapeptide repeat-containing protein [Sediminibacillus halophilus]